MYLILTVALITVVLNATNRNPDLDASNFINELSSTELYEYLQGYIFPESPLPGDSLYQEFNTINDTLQAPFIYYIPPVYDHNSKTPLLVYLHGGVNRPEYLEEPFQFARENPFLAEARRLGWFMLFPLANEATMWWDSTGIKNIKDQIRYMKGLFNIDDDRIYITGFSDGASGSFHLALCNPDLFAAFYPLNGMLSVGSAVSSEPVYLPNLANRHVYAINTDNDKLYPAEEMRKVMQLALDAGADLYYREYWGFGHNFDYADAALPLLITDMQKRCRDPFPSRIYWECSHPDFGKIDWLEIIAIDTTRTRENWQQEYNVILTDKRLYFGLYLEEQNGSILITDVVENSVATQMGLWKDDIILAMDAIKVNSIEELLDIRDSKDTGDSFSLTINRNGAELTLSGAFPDVRYYDALKYNKPSGAVSALYCANVFTMQTSKIKTISIYISPQMINPEQPLKIIINDQIYFDDKIEFDKDIIWQEFQKNFDRSNIIINKLTLQLL